MEPPRRFRKTTLVKVPEILSKYKVIVRIYLTAIRSLSMTSPQVYKTEKTSLFQKIVVLLHPQKRKEYEQECTRAHIRPDCQYFMGTNGSHRQICTYGVFGLVGNYVPHGGRSGLFLAIVGFLQTRTRGSPGYAENILRITLCTGIQSRGLYLRTFNDFAH